MPSQYRTEFSLRNLFVVRKSTRVKTSVAIVTADVNILSRPNVDDRWRWLDVVDKIKSLRLLLLYTGSGQDDDGDNDKQLSIL